MGGGDDTVAPLLFLVLQETQGHTLLSPFPLPETDSQEQISSYSILQQGPAGHILVRCTSIAKELYERNTSEISLAEGGQKP